MGRRAIRRPGRASNRTTNDDQQTNHLGQMRFAEIRFKHQNGVGDELLQFDATTPEYENRTFRQVLNHEFDWQIIDYLNKQGYRNITDIEIKEVGQ